MEPKHCDSYIHDLSAPLCLRIFLLVHRLPAADGVLLKQCGVNPRLFADFQGNRVRVTMASRFGDIGISKNLDREYGYDVRIAVDDLSNFGDTK